MSMQSLEAIRDCMSAIAILCSLTDSASNTAPVATPNTPNNRSRSLDREPGAYSTRTDSWIGLRHTTTYFEQLLPSGPTNT